MPPEEDVAVLSREEAAQGWTEVEPGIYILPEEVWDRRQSEAYARPNALLNDPTIRQLVDTLRERYDLGEDDGDTEDS